MALTASFGGAFTGVLTYLTNHAAFCWRPLNAKKEITQHVLRCVSPAFLVRESHKRHLLHNLDSAICAHTLRVLTR
eukprot:1744484-Pyramimonas_sp.AAC.1